ncbi:hypothetical protein J2S49_000787 [Arcanobacterium wilhelmae]|uniref:Uncharacterized protein n=1 Tax=Arcanobacterium wilhelmae TaxID=1803177 RepID=A0ABT9NAK0_9ACTO|nr:hypothetical protein [Arcanobacterium wilhelmae]MDP9800711.1 hypothetical protein [Arcanobacterium wilhelmae]WFN90110.1 hypothetical protein P8A24_07935 [Arcanobacterium wilhelmae]
MDFQAEARRKAHVRKPASVDFSADAGARVPGPFTRAFRRGT